MFKKVNLFVDKALDKPGLVARLSRWPALRSIDTGWEWQLAHILRSAGWKKLSFMLLLLYLLSVLPRPKDGFVVLARCCMRNVLAEI
jgi:hypothetical protein